MERGICTADKVKVAREVVKESAGFTILDLKKQIDKTIAFIREANSVDDNEHFRTHRACSRRDLNT